MSRLGYFPYRDSEIDRHVNDGVSFPSLRKPAKVVETTYDRAAEHHAVYASLELFAPPHLKDPPHGPSPHGHVLSIAVPLAVAAIHAALERIATSLHHDDLFVMHTRRLTLHLAER